MRDHETTRTEDDEQDQIEFGQKFHGCSDSVLIEMTRLISYRIVIAPTETALPASSWESCSCVAPAYRVQRPLLYADRRVHISGKRLLRERRMYIAGSVSRRLWMVETTESVIGNDPILDRLEDQIKWYDRKSRWCPNLLFALRFDFLRPTSRPSLPHQVLRLRTGHTPIFYGMEEPTFRQIHRQKRFSPRSTEIRSLL
jgi:hypothetical protein